MKGERATGSKEGTVMAKIGRVVTSPSGAYCNITLRSGEKIIFNHEPGARGTSAGARLTITSVAYAQECA